MSQQAAPGAQVDGVLDVVREPGRASVWAQDQPGATATSGTTTVRVVTDDMPFLVDSVLAVLAHSGRSIRRLSHPRHLVLRDAEGRLLEARPAGGADAPDDGAGLMTESHIEAEVSLDADDPGGVRLVEAVSGVLRDVRAAVEDWDPMRRRARELATALVEDPAAGGDEAERRRAAAFLSWMAQDRFTFLGHRVYDARVLEDGSGRTVLDGRDSGALGVSRFRPARRGLEAEAEDGGGPAPVLAVWKAAARSTVHRPSHLDCVAVRLVDSGGRVVREHRFLGLFTSSARSEPLLDVPVVADKVRTVLRRAGVRSQDHSGRDLISVLETLPRDELLQADPGWITDTSLAVLDLKERRKTRLFLRYERQDRVVSCLVYLPRDRYTTGVGHRVGQRLLEALGGAEVEQTLQVSESVLARLHFVVRARPGERLLDRNLLDTAALERSVAALARSWQDALVAAARDAEPGDEERVARWADGIPDSYRSTTAPADALVDLRRCQEVLDGPDDRPVLELRRDVDDPSAERRLVFYRSHPETLTSMMPVLTNLGVEVLEEVPHRFEAADGRRVWIEDLRLRFPAPSTDVDPDRGVDAEALGHRFCDAYAAVATGLSETDSLDRLVLAAGLTWRQVALVRAWTKYLRQVGLAHTPEGVADVLLSATGVVRLLVRLFEARFAPLRSGGHDDLAEYRTDLVAALEEEVGAALDRVESLDADRVLRALLSVVRAVVRTNAYQRDQQSPDGQLPTHLSFKLAPRLVAGMPDPAPHAEVWVYSPRVEGVHLRYGEVARGGLRWSDRREDFRTEVLGLVKAQVVKNAVIVPTGAKGGFVAKQLPDPAVDRDAWWAEGTACYRTFISGLLDVTDDLRTTEGEDGLPVRVVVPPADVVRYDGDDYYLVVAADKGTATFSDTANAISLARGFWLGDAFASGGSVGYDHKAMGITARGAWESVRRHFRELGHDTQTQPFTAVGVGDMSGDVFGNGMLLSEQTRLVAAFDHRHVFLDPDPDPATSHAERARLFALPRSSWADYDRSLISEGGGVYPRTAKSVPVSPQVARRLGLDPSTASMSPVDLLRAVLAAPVDLFWNGGIGTYVKASTESHADVGDKANDAIRIDGRDLRVRVVGEGGNLGLTQRGRIEAAQSGRDGEGVKLNTDAIDNSAGVDCSDHEVNIKILLDQLVARGQLDAADRDATLLRMTDEVGRLVLRDNYEQNVALSVEGALAHALLPAHRRFLDELARTGAVDLQLEALPTAVELDRRAREGGGLTMPELSVLIAHAKITLGRAVLSSSLPDEDWVTATLRSYFPAELGGRFASHLADHPLRREIATTVLVNRVVGLGGLTFAFRAAEETGAEPADVVRAFVVAARVFGLPERAAAVEALDGRVPVAAQVRMRSVHQRLLDRSVRWLLHTRPEGIDVAAEVARFAPDVARLAPAVDGLIGGADLHTVEVDTEDLVALGVPAGEARRTAGLLALFPLLEIVDIATRGEHDVDLVAAAWFEISRAYDIETLLLGISALPRDDSWQVLARASLRDDLYSVHRELTEALLRERSASGRSAAGSTALADQVAALRERFRDVAVRAEDEGAPLDLTSLTVSLWSLRSHVRSLQRSVG
ncbi:NAD-glutamate dehydrogenase [Quadrisphaera setariae]|nr:NAD-glutamate dehydrogenase [Quadrisphaera setariae]